MLGLGLGSVLGFRLGSVLGLVLGSMLGLGLGSGLWLGLGLKPSSPIIRELVLGLTWLSFPLVRFGITLHGTLQQQQPAECNYKLRFPVLFPEQKATEKQNKLAEIMGKQVASTVASTKSNHEKVDKDLKKKLLAVYSHQSDEED